MLKKEGYKEWKPNSKENGKWAIKFGVEAQTGQLTQKNGKQINDLDPSGSNDSDSQSGTSGTENGSDEEEEDDDV